MIGLIILIIGTIYLAVLVLATRVAYRWAKSKGMSKAKCRLVSVGGFLAIYLPLFWDHIPTLIAHQYYCTTEAGFWEYKSIEQWKKENPGVARSLKVFGVDVNQMPRTASGDTLLNDRFLHRYEKLPVGLFPNWRRTISIVDRKTGVAVASDIDFQSGYGNLMSSGDWRGWKFWLRLESCLSLEEMQMNRGYVEYRNQIMKLGVEK